MRRVALLCALALTALTGTTIQAAPTNAASVADAFPLYAIEVAVKEVQPNGAWSVAHDSQVIAPAGQDAEDGYSVLMHYPVSCTLTEAGRQDPQFMAFCAQNNETDFDVHFKVAPSTPGHVVLVGSLRVDAILAQLSGGQDVYEVQHAQRLALNTPTVWTSYPVAGSRNTMTVTLTVRAIPRPAVALVQ
jgi:hypothetical protein